MTFLLDAQLPPSLKHVFLDKGHACIHTSDLPAGNDTPDKVINQLSVAEQWVVITKDGDFFDSFILKHGPYKLILVKLGNMSKITLIQFFYDYFDEITERIKTESLLLLTKQG